MKKTVLLLVCTIFVLAACAPSEPAAPQDDLQAAGDDLQDAAEDIQDAQEDVAAAEEDASDALDDIKGMFTRQMSLSFDVTYDISTDAQGETFDGTMRQIMKGTDRIRMDTTVEGTESRTLIVDEKVYTCMNQGEWQCYEFSGEETKVDTKEVVDDFEENEEQYEVNRLPDRTIAGTKATCYEMIHPEARTEYCFSKEAAPLYVKVVADGYTSEMIATKYSTTVPANAFDLPAEPQDLSAMMGGFDPSAYQ